jgi:hypothetical protein
MEYYDSMEWRELIPIDELVDRLQKIRVHNEAIETQEVEHRSLLTKARQLEDYIAKAEAKLADVNKQISELPNLGEMIDDQEILEQIKSAESNNIKIQANHDWGKADAVITEKKEEVNRQTLEMKSILAMKNKLLEEVSFPIPNLAFDKDQVLYNGLPLDQAGSAEQLRVATAIGIAQNPKLKALLIRDGSLLDDDNLALIKQVASEFKAMLWIERVGKGKEATVVIEDGEILKEDDYDDSSV